MGADKTRNGRLLPIGLGNGRTAPDVNDVFAVVMIFCGVVVFVTRVCLTETVVDVEVKTSRLVADNDVETRLLLLDVNTATEEASDELAETSMDFFQLDVVVVTAPVTGFVFNLTFDDLVGVTMMFDVSVITPVIISEFTVNGADDTKCDAFA